MKKPLLLVCSLATFAAGAALVRAGDAPPDQIRQDYNITVEGFVPPQSVRQPLPYYDDTLKRIGLEGTVVVKGRIDEQGRVRDVETVSGHPVLGRAARQAVERWRYTPARVAEKPVSVGLAVTVDFHLREASGPDQAVTSAKVRPVVTAVAKTSPDGYF